MVLRPSLITSQTMQISTLQLLCALVCSMFCAEAVVWVFAIEGHKWWIWSAKSFPTAGGVRESCFEFFPGKIRVLRSDW